VGRQSWSNRTTVEQCFTLTTTWLNRNGYFTGNKGGRIEWKNSREEINGSIGIEVMIDNSDINQSYMRLYYTITKNQNLLFPKLHGVEVNNTL